MILGEKIKEIREKKGVTPKNLAANLDIDISTLNRIENGKVVTFKPQFLEKMAAYLGVKVSDFFDSHEKVNIPSDNKEQNINVLNLKEQNEKLESLYERLLSAKENEISLLKEQINVLKKSVANKQT